MVIEIDLEAWHHSHPRASKWYSEWYVDFNPKGSTKSGRYSWTGASNLILQRDNYKCRLCGSDGYNQRVKDSSGYLVKSGLEVHHIIPKHIGGSDHAENLITLCRKCHKRTFKGGYGGIRSNRGITLDKYLTED